MPEGAGPISIFGGLLVGLLGLTPEQSSRRRLLPPLQRHLEHAGNGAGLAATLATLVVAGLGLPAVERDLNLLLSYPEAAGWPLFVVAGLFAAAVLRCAVGVAGAWRYAGGAADATLYRPMAHALLVTGAAITLYLLWLYPLGLADNNGLRLGVFIAASIAGPFLLASGAVRSLLLLHNAPSGYDLVSDDIEENEWTWTDDPPRRRR